MSRSVHDAGRTVGGLLCIVLVTAFLTGNAPHGSSPRPSHQTADTTCDACRDFYDYANRAWLDTATIPPTMSDWGAYSSNAAQVSASLHAILDDAAAAGGAPDTRTGKLGVFYSSCMDSARAEREGIAPLQDELTRIGAVDDPAGVVRELAALQRDGIPVAFSFSSDVDRLGDLRYVAMIEQGRLPLAVEVYTGADSASARKRDAYRAHVARVLVLAGESDADAARDAGDVMEIETALARASMTRLQMVEASVSDAYRELPFATLEASTPGFPWAAYLRDRGSPALRTVVVPQPAFLTAVARLIHERPAAEWRAYLRWHVLSDAAPFLSSAFVAEHFRYASGASGAVALPPRWNRCVTETSDDLPELLGRAYAERTFSSASKARMNAMVEQMRAILITRLATVPWLTAASRRVALEKARRFGVKIGYPDEWHDYGALRLGRASFVLERATARRFESDRLVARIGRAPDRAQWDFHGQYHFVPQSPTAWANWDEIIFPAAYLHPPVFDSTADLATNFGGIGVVIAHEMTHLFTADGGDIDEAGRIRRWWAPADSVRFAAVAVRTVAQYDAYTLLDSATHVNGALTLDENLADIGGVELAYAALERALAGRPRVAPGDTTPEQRFFLAYARSRVSKSRPAYVRHALATDGHAPDRFRVDGPLSDFPPFAAAFRCAAGDPMMRPDSVRVQVW